ncbi:MAG TPA: protease inhibitor I42 family protein [Gemmataceae bacterium]|nr:protease inhibitor I42 family protein [Gemmataceae bacterium]
MTPFARTIIGLALLAALTPAVTGFQAGAKTITLTDKDADAKVELAKGDKLVVKLAANTTTGFTWVIASKEDDKLLKSSGKPDYVAPEKKAVGAGGIQVFTFTTEGAGMIEVELHYKRTFEKDKAPAKTFKFKVTIK